MQCSDAYILSNHTNKLVTCVSKTCSMHAKNNGMTTAVGRHHWFRSMQFTAIMVTM